MDGGLSSIQDDDLLLLLGEELKQPLVAISQLSELEKTNPNISAHAKKALRTIDNVLTYRRVNSGQIALKLEPVHVGYAIKEVSEELQPLMKASGCRTDVRIQKSLSLVDADKELLHGALQGMWQALVGTLSEPSDVVCSAKKTKGGVRLSVTSPRASVEELHLKDANTKSSQPIKSVSGPATDLLTASGMFELLGYKITKTSAKSHHGFGVTLNASKQMQIV